MLFIVVHAYTLVHLVLLTDKAKRFHQALHHQIGQKSGLPKDEFNRRAAIRGHCSANCRAIFSSSFSPGRGHSRGPIRLAAAGNRLVDAGGRAGPACCF